MYTLSNTFWKTAEINLVVESAPSLCLPAPLSAITNSKNAAFNQDLRFAVAVLAFLLAVLALLLAILHFVILVLVLVVIGVQALDAHIAVSASLLCLLAV